MRRILIYCNIFWLLFGTLTCVESYRLKIGKINQPGPGLFPFGSGLVMIILSLIGLFMTITRKEEKGEIISQDKIRWWNIVIIIAAISAYAFSLEKVGFLINTFLFITILLKVVEPQSWKKSILGGLITALAANVVFNVIFRVQIPSGILGF